MRTILSPIGRGQGNELVNRLEAAGLDSNLAQRVIDSKGNDLAAKVVRFIQSVCNRVDVPHPHPHSDSISAAIDAGTLDQDGRLVSPAWD